MLILVPSASSRSLWGMVIRLKKYCSEVISSLIRPGSQLQSIQCNGSSFPFDIFGLPSFLYIYGACPYYQSFLEGHFDHQDLYLIYAQLVLFLLGLSSHLYPTPFLSWNHQLPFGRPRTTHALGQGSRSNCIIWAHDPIVWNTNFLYQFLCFTLYFINHNLQCICLIFFIK